MLQIKEVYGFTLSYDEKRRMFVLTDGDKTEVGSSNTQDGAEVKAKQLSKREFKRIKIIRVKGEGKVILGELTSLNRDEPSAWVSMEKSDYIWGSGREKMNVRYDKGTYEATEANLKVIEAIRVKRGIIDQALTDIQELIEQMEKPINKDYFGIT